MFCLQGGRGAHRLPRPMLRRAAEGFAWFLSHPPPTVHRHTLCPLYAWLKMPFSVGRPPRGRPPSCQRPVSAGVTGRLPHSAADPRPASPPFPDLLSRPAHRRTLRAAYSPRIRCASAIMQQGSLEGTSCLPGRHELRPGDRTFVPPTTPPKSSIPNPHRLQS